MLWTPGPVGARSVRRASPSVCAVRAYAMLMSEVDREPSSDEQRLIRTARVARERAKQIHWGKRHAARRLTANERREIQSRLYTSRSAHPSGRLQYAVLRAPSAVGGGGGNHPSPSARRQRQARTSRPLRSDKAWLPHHGPSTSYEQPMDAPQPEDGLTSTEEVSPEPSPPPKARHEPRHARNKVRQPRTTRDTGSRTRRDTFWNRDYRPTPLGTDPIPVLAQPEEGWIGIGGPPPMSRGMERRMANPHADIEIMGGTRAHSAKEVGPSRVAQQWKEGLRHIVPDPLTAEEAELEQLRTLLRRGAGIGTPTDRWTPYTGPAEEEIIQRVVEDYINAQGAPAPAPLSPLQAHRGEGGD